jgi:hypothetical protein
MSEAMKRRVLPLLLLALLAGRDLPLVRSDAEASRAVDDDVLEAVFRQQVEDLLDGEERARGVVICLAIDPGRAPQSVSREFLARFRAEPSVRRAAECEARPEGAVTLGRPRPAVIVTAGPIEWIAADEAWVTVSRFRSRENNRQWPYRVVREPTGWVSLGPIIKQAPS